MDRHLTQGLLLASSALVIAGSAASADEAKHVSSNMMQLKFGPVVGIPTCAKAAVESGDPSKGSAILMVNAATGCKVPWHWHTAAEHLMVVSGDATLEMKGDKPVGLRAGGYALMPGQHQHQFTCVKACSFFLYTDGAFDIHYVDAKGAEITPDAALKAVKETAATPNPI